MDDTTTLGAYLRAERERRDLPSGRSRKAPRFRCRCSKGSNPTTFRAGRAEFSAGRLSAPTPKPSGWTPTRSSGGSSGSTGPPRTTPGHRTRLSLPQKSSPWRRPPGFTAVRPSARRIGPDILGTAADMTVALVLAFGSAAAGSRLLWPVLLIAAYYAAGVLLTGTSPMVALLGEPSSFKPSARPRRVISPGRVNRRERRIACSGTRRTARFPDASTASTLSRALARPSWCRLSTSRVRVGQPLASPVQGTRRTDL